MTPTVKQLAQLARDGAELDPIDWSGFSVNETTAYEMMASNVLEQFANIPEQERNTVAMATITKLLVENFVLNVKLMRKK